MKPAAYRVGRITVAGGLVAVGLALLSDNMLSSHAAMAWVLKLWPLLLVGFGLEYMIRSALLQRSTNEVPANSLRFDVGGAIFLLLIIFLSTGVQTFRGWISEGPGIISMQGGLGVSRKEERTVKLNGSQEVRLEVKMGSVEFQAHSRQDELLVEAEYSAPGLVVDADRVRRELEGAVLKVTEGSVTRIEADIPSTLQNVSVRYTVYAPPDLNVHVSTGTGSIRVVDYRGSMNLESRMGKITVEAGSGSLALNASMGSLSVRQFRGAVAARASMGSINVDGVEGPLQLEAGQGSIRVDGFTGKVEAETRMGSIHATTQGLVAGDVTLRSSTGSINLTVPRESSMRVTAQTRMGSVSAPAAMAVSGGGPSRSAAGTFGDGKHAVTLEANTGSIHLETP